MADKKISQLPNGVINSNSIFPLVSNGVTAKVSYSDMLAAFSGGGSGVGTFEQVTENGNKTTQEFYNEYIHQSGIKMLAGVFSGETNHPFPLNGVKIDYSEVAEGQYIKMGFGIGEGPFIQLDFNEGGGAETVRKYFYFDFEFESNSNDGQRILTNLDLQPIYKGVFNQEGTSDPIIQEFYNNTQFPEFNFSRYDEGYYSVQIGGNYIAYINVSQNVLDPDDKVIASVRYEPKSDQTIFDIYTYSGGVLSDNVVTNMFFEIGIKELP